MLEILKNDQRTILSTITVLVLKTIYGFFAGWSGFLEQ